jgi:ADP-L-glycero-D-manno-heptose 6-epimerase
MASMVYKMVPLIQKEGVLKLFQSLDRSQYQDGETLRDFIYVKDAVRITCELLDNDVTGIFNVGTGIPSTWNALAKSVFDALGKKVCIEYIPMPESMHKQYQNYTCAVMDRLQLHRKNLGPLCQYSLQEAVFDYVQNHLVKDQRW